MNAAFEAAKAAGDNATRKKLVEDVHAKHQAALDADPDGQKIFVPAMKSFVPKLEEVEPAYKFVNAVEDAPESAAMTVTRQSPAGPRTMTFSRISNDVIAMLQAGGEENVQEERVWEKVREASLNEAQKIYQRLDVNLTPADVRGESWYRDRLPQTVAALRHPVRNAESEQVHIAVQDSDGAVVVFHRSPAGAPMFLNKEGEPLPFLVRKSDGAFLYSTTDLAALRYRIDELRADRLVYVIGAPQALHLEMLFTTGRGAGWTLGQHGPAMLEHVAFGSMLGEDGKPFRTRSGESVKLADLLDEAIRRATEVVREKRSDFTEKQLAYVGNAVGIGAIKYADLARDRVSDYLFSWEKMLALNGNTAVYLLYAQARIQSIFRKAGGKAPAGTKLSLEASHELALAKHILRLGDTIASVARDLKPHVLCTYLYELATIFSGFFENCPVIQSPEPMRSSRLLLCDLTARTLQIGLDLLGIDHPDEM
jgi:arginyl-tRNA synthetase